VIIMNLASRRPKRDVVAFGVAVLAVALVATSSPTADAATEASGPDSTTRQRLQSQRPLVDAATVVRTAVERSRATGLASINIETDSVAVWWKGGSAALPSTVTAAVAAARALAPVRVADATYSMAELRAASTRLEKAIGGDGRFHGIKAEPDGSGLIVKTAPGPQVLSGMPDVTVPTRMSVEPRMTPVSRGNDSSPWSGGALIVNTSIGAACTSGFGVNTPGGPAVLSAGHCGNAGNRFNDGAGEQIGNVGGVDKNFDVLLIPTNAVSNQMYVGNGASNDQRTVTSGGAPFVGELLCQSGNTSANAIGSQICNMQVQFEGTDAQRLWEARQLDGQIAARPGDSGGPVYDDRGDGTVIARGTTTRVAGSGFGFAGFEKAQQDFGVSIPGSTTNPGGVVFYQDVNFVGGASQSLPVGNYNLAALQARGIPNDWASSARIPAGRTVSMFQDDNFTGTRWVLTSDTANFVTLSPNANDQASSIIVQ
jgi:hypothetical protein